MIYIVYMLKDLTLKGEYAKDPELMITHMLIGRVEDAFKKYLGCDRVYYYAYDFSWDKTGEPVGPYTRRMVWFGPDLFDFIRKAKKHRWGVLMATSVNSKGKVVDDCDCLNWARPEHKDTCPENAYWIGDVAYWRKDKETGEVSPVPGGRMVCCDDLWMPVWKRMTDRIYGRAVE